MIAPKGLQLGLTVVKGELRSKFALKPPLGGSDGDPAAKV